MKPEVLVHYKYRPTVKPNYAGKFCYNPYQMIEIDEDGDVMLCGCQFHMPYAIGNIYQSSIKEIWHNAQAQLVRDSVAAGEFTYCNWACPNLQYLPPRPDIIPKADEFPTNIKIDLDRSCNLKCPSCRRELIMHDSGLKFEEKLKDIKTIIQWLENSSDGVNIILTGNGDPLASHIIRPFIKNYTPKPNQIFTFVTNGLLIKKHLVDSPIFHQIKNYRISVDAGSAESYALTRGANWSVLLENFNFLVEHKKQELVTLNFCVQKNNYKDIPNFIKLCADYGFYGNIHQLDDWGTWPGIMPENPDVWTIKNGTFLDHNVLDYSHPEFADCRDIVKTELSRLSNNRILFSGRLKELLNL